MTDIPYRQADFHIHTPASECYNIPTVTPEQVVDAALAAGLEVMAVTDHNSFAWVERVAAAAEGKGLAVFPGTELTTAGGHITGIFDPGTPSEYLEGLLDRLDIHPNRRGDGSCMIDRTTEEVLEAIGAWGGIAIAAHIERWPRGFLESDLSRSEKMRIHAGNLLAALEITIPQNREAWNRGTMRNYPKPYACIQSSDAHDLREIGRRRVHIRLERTDLASLKQAFGDCGGSIAFPEETCSG